MCSHEHWSAPHRVLEVNPPESSLITLWDLTVLVSSVSAVRDCATLWEIVLRFHSATSEVSVLALFVYLPYQIALYGRAQKLVKLVRFPNHSLNTAETDIKSMNYCIYQIERCYTTPSPAKLKNTLLCLDLLSVFGSFATGWFVENKGRAI